MIVPLGVPVEPGCKDGVCRISGDYLWQSCQIHLAVPDVNCVVSHHEIRCYDLLR
jgi:hypothetical protein